MQRLQRPEVVDCVVQVRADQFFQVRRRRNDRISTRVRSADGFTGQEDPL